MDQALRWALRYKRELEIIFKVTGQCKPSDMAKPDVLLEGGQILPEALRPELRALPR